ncbi:MAG TPA: chitobiase/beta-hexosaminidase C-terminal domain-containing protein [Gaiellaceae bacterium]
MTGFLVRLIGKRRRLLALSAIVLLAGALAGGLVAYFSGAAAAGSAGGGAATSMAPGRPPTTVTSQPGRSVTITWPATTLADGHPVDGYLVTRYEAGPPFAPQTALAGCSGVLTALSCTELGVPFGSWQYTITPVIGTNWRGLESTKSGAVTIGAASLVLDQTTLGSADFAGVSGSTHLTGALSGFASNEGVDYKLDDSSGATLGGSPANVDASGSATVSITLPRPSDGPHSIYAVGNATPYPSQASAAVLVDTTPPTSSASGNDGAWHASDVTVALSAADGAGSSGVKDIRYEVDGGTLQTISGASGNVTISAVPGGSNDGVHTLTFFATDNAGNDEAPAHSVTVEIDTTKPSTSLTTSPSSPDGTNGWFTQAGVQFSLAGSDANAGVAQSFYTVDGGPTQTYSGAVTVSGQGTHAITYWSADNAGNTEAANTAQLRLDTVEPSTSTAVSPAAPNGSGGWYVTTPSFTLSASDATSGVASTLYKIDSGATQTYSGAVSIPDGQHTVSYWSVDAAGNVESATTTATIKVDTVKPSTSIAISPASPDGTNGWRVSATTFTLSGSDASSGVGSTFYRIDAGATQTYSGSAVSIAQGTHTVSYWSVDTAENVESANTTTIKVDTVKPSTSLTTTPAVPDGSNNWFKRSSVTFTLAASDATSGVANSYYTLDGGGQQTYSGTVTVSGQGDHTVTYWSTDTAGNTETATTTHIKLDNVAPTSSLALTNKTGGSFLSGTTIYYRGGAGNSGSFSIQNTLTDATSGPASSTFAALGGTATGWTHTTPDVKSTPAGGPYVSNLFSWSAGTASSPTEVVTGADAAGNSAAAPTLTLTNDATAPSTTDNTASIGSTCKNTNQTVTLSPTDAGSGAAATYYTTNGSTPTTSSSQGTSIVLSTDGTYTIKYFSVDNVGNQEGVKTASTTICIDKTAPAPTNVVLANGGTVGSADSGDTLTITYSEQLDATTFCSTWGNSGTQSLAGVTVLITQSGTNDILSISAVGAGSCGGATNFHLDSVALGRNYVTANRTFSSSQITWDPAARTLTVRLGTASGSVRTGVGLGTPTYTPSGSLKDIAGNTIVTSAFSAPGTSRF